MLYTLQLGPNLWRVLVCTRERPSHWLAEQAKHQDSGPLMLIAIDTDESLL